MRGTPSDLERRLRLPYATLMIGANVIGAVSVAAIVFWAVPLPPVADSHATLRANAIALAVYLALSVPIGVLWVLRLLRPVRRWLHAGRPPTAEEQRAVLLTPAREMLVHAVLWALGGVAFTLLNLQYGQRLALVVAIAVSLAASATCAIAYLLSQRLLRPVAALALAGDVPERPQLPGVQARILLSWGLGTGVPVVGVTAVGAGQLTGVLHASGDRIAVGAVALGGVGMVVGVTVMVLMARALSDPLREVRGALARVQSGDTDVSVPIYDGSEVGLLQAGFNAMVEGVRERERLRDLFGRQVGEDVALRALEKGVELGGEERDVAVLFVDLVGSTQLAHRRRPAEVVELLNAFFAIVVDVIGHAGGSVNKLVGDAALCVFGAPLDHEDAACAALRAARALRDRLAEDLPGCEAGIGVSAGTVVAGNVGAAERFEYTVIGDAVNEAARLTELAKRHPGRVLASDAVLERAAGSEEPRHWEACGTEVLRGRGEPTELSAPLG